VLRGAMDATSPQEVAQKLSARGYQPVQVQQGEAAASATSAQQQQQTRAASAAATPGAGGFSFGAPVKPEDLGLFFRQLQSLSHAGFTPSAALADLGPRTANVPIRGAALRMARETAAGASLAGAMAKHPGVFPRHVVGLVEAGEAGGFLPFAFEEAALGAEQDAALKQNGWVIRLLWWQSVWSVLLGQAFFLNLDKMFTSGGGLASFGLVLRSLLFVWIPLGLLCHVLAFAAGWVWRQPGFAPTRDRLVLMLPAAARLARMRALASFTRVLRRLLKSGISAEPAFAGAARAVPNGVLQEQLLRGAAVLRQGEGLDAAIQATGLMGHDPLQLLITGQKTGQWAETLEQVTAYYQEEAANATEAAKSAVKRAAAVITLLSAGYVLVAATYYGYRAIFRFADTFTE